MGDATYAVTRERDGSYHLHASTPLPRVIARIAPVLDRAGDVLGWKLKPAVVMQRATTRAALVKRTEGSTWQFRGARFELTGDEFTRGTHEYRYIPGYSAVGGESGDTEGEDEEGSLAGEDAGRGFDEDAPAGHDELAA